jgi:hypothetical protein
MPGNEYISFYLGPPALDHFGLIETESKSIFYFFKSELAILGNQLKVFFRRMRHLQEKNEHW